MVRENGPESVGITLMLLLHCYYTVVTLLLCYYTFVTWLQVQILRYSSQVDCSGIST